MLICLIHSQSTLTKEDYIHLLQKQDALHRAETERWRDALSEVIKLIHLVSILFSLYLLILEKLHKISF